ncbi:MAG: hypothetical protein J2P27_05265 [Actinobacteria bacterium]|nr:hypothetical protein [Actinomycetota bacterium]
MKWSTCVIVLPLTAILLLAGCSGNAAHGIIAGTFERVGGPPPGAPVALPGHVVAVNSAGAQFTVAVTKSGRFRLAVPPGVYQLAGYSPLIDEGKARCSATHVVHVTAGKLSPRALVICSIP